MSVDVVCAIICERGRYLCVQRSKGKLAGKWEFAGGKVEIGETPQQACERELLEELSITVKAGEVLFENTIQIEEVLYNLLFIEAEVRYGVVSLIEHSDYKWVETASLHKLDWLDGDIPMVKWIQRELT